MYICIHLCMYTSVIYSIHMIYIYIHLVVRLLLYIRLPYTHSHPLPHYFIHQLLSCNHTPIYFWPPNLRIPIHTHCHTTSSTHLYHVITVNDYPFNHVSMYNHCHIHLASSLLVCPHINYPILSTIIHSMIYIYIIKYTIYSVYI